MTDIRTRLPGVVDPTSAGELARDAAQGLASTPSLQLVSVNNQTYAPPFVVRMSKAPKAVFCGVKLTTGEDTGTTAIGGSVAWTWTGNGIRVRAIDGLTAGTGVRYNFAFLGVG